MAAVVIVAGGCSAARTTQTAPEQAKDPSTLTLLAELALERGDCRLAAEDYAAAAMQSSVAVVRRASEVGLACENLPAAWQSAQRWRALAPADADAATTYAAIAVKLYKIPQAVAAAQTVIKAAGANANERIGQLATALLEEAEAPAVLAVMAAAVGPNPSPETLTLLAQLSLEAYDPERAQRYAQQAYAAEPSLTAASSSGVPNNVTRSPALIRRSRPGQTIGFCSASLRTPSGTKLPYSSRRVASRSA